MIKNVALFDVLSYQKKWFSYLVLILFFVFGFFGGNQFNMSFGEGIYVNSPFTIGMMLGFLSLSLIFIGTVIGLQILFREEDSRFTLIIFSTPILKKDFLTGRFLSFFIVVFLVFSSFFLGFVVGQFFRSGEDVQKGFHLSHYLYAYFVFGFLNCLLVCSFLFFIALVFRQKMVLVVGGLLLYIFYMVALIFSNSPIMNSSMPQTVFSQIVSAVVDIFGLSGYLFESRDFSVIQRNSITVPFSGYFFLNRLLVLILSVVLLFLAYRYFRFSQPSSKKMIKKKERYSILNNYFFETDLLKVESKYSIATAIKSIFSFSKLDLFYVFKSIAFIGSILLLIFAVGMEMYAEIENNIRMPNKFASSGLMASTIIENFHFLGILLIAYFTNELYFRSQSSRFFMIEKPTYFSFNKLIGHWLSIACLAVVYSLFLIVEGVVFQLVYQYPKFDSKAYLGILVFNTFPIILFGGFSLLINQFFRNKYIALTISIISSILFATSYSKKIFEIPLFRIFSGFNGEFSDMNCFGIYLSSFLTRSIFGFGVIILFWLVLYLISNKTLKKVKWVALCLLMISTIFLGRFFMKGFANKNEETQNIELANYEKKYKHYEKLAQPTVKSVKTEISLYSEERSYTVKGIYLIQNLTAENIKKILFNLDENMRVKNVKLKFKNQVYQPKNNIEEIVLKSEMLPHEVATIEFEMDYKWFPVNGHQSFNAIIENGSFMRISRFFPVFGYQKDVEISDVDERKKYGLGNQSEIKKVEAPKTETEDFIDLEMTISTTKNQTAVGTGDLVKNWSLGNRNFFQYKVNRIPFRFAVSSANYKKEAVTYKGIKFEVFYDAKHPENVKRLIENAKISYDYCTENFGKYPFNSITFAEVSLFTTSFNATAYPGVIFMTENMAFHANISENKDQDVINELAGHELSHFWWGNSQISPDDREGAPLLTETLAMYTEMMIYKKMYGRNKMLEKLNMHQQIFDEEKGFGKPEALFRVTPENTYISYSKGAMVMVDLSELIGEKRLNAVLKEFLKNYKYPKKPTSKDFLEILYSHLSMSELAIVRPWFEKP